jgi:transposase
MPRKPKYRRPYPPEFRREAVALYARTDRTLGEIAADLGVSRESLRLWVRQAQIERGEREGLTGDEREELRELRRRVLLLEQEREILKKAAAFFVKESEPVSVHRGGEGQSLDLADVPAAWCLPLRLPRLGAAAGLGSCPCRRLVERADHNHPPAKPRHLRRSACACGAPLAGHPGRS